MSAGADNSSRHASSLIRMHSRMRTLQGNTFFEYVGLEGIQIRCAHNPYSRSNMLEIGGQQVEADLVLWALKTEFFVTSDQAVNPYTSLDEEGEDHPGENLTDDNRPYPVAGLELTFAGRVFRIEKVIDPMPVDLACQVEILCVDATK